MTTPTSIPTIVLGSSGYVAGELLRYLAGHPVLKLSAAVSESSAGKPLSEAFPNLQGSFDGQSFVARGELDRAISSAGERLAIFSAAPHGSSAELIAEALEAADRAGAESRVVDLSADFRYADAQSYEAVYRQRHGAPELLPRFRSALPEHLPEGAPEHVGHPGCFTTAVTLASVPLLALGLVEPDLFVVGVTGSTGSGREPKPTTHHPVRQSNLFAYQPLVHRHLAEMTSLAENASGTRPSIHFVPHSGPFARGIHATVQARLKAELDSEALASELARFYESAPFVRVVPGTPRVKDVVGSNYAQLGVAAQNGTVAVFSVIDNLVKGASGGGVQWMNRLFGLPETTGLTMPGPGWV